MRRTLQAIPIIIGISIVVFGIVYLAPGNPTDRFRTPNVPPELIQSLMRQYGLDRPLHEQYLSWASTFFQVWKPEAWGYSFLSGEPAMAKIMARVPATLILMGTALIITIIVAIPVGMLAALKQYSWTDKVITSLATIGYALPTFILGTWILYFGAVTLSEWTNGQIKFPAFGMESLGKRGDPLDIAWHLVLPVLTLSIVSIAAWSRYMRTSMLEVLHQDYIRTARRRAPRAGRSSTATPCATPSSRSSRSLASRSRSSSRAPPSPSTSSRGPASGTSSSRRSATVTTRSSSPSR